MPAPLDLIDQLRRVRFDHALLTTYNLGAEFFEGYCIRNLDAFAHAGNIVVFVDPGIYAKLLHAQGRDRPRLAGRRYFLNPVTNCRGVFHPKVYLFANKRRGLLILGSCNLSKAGFTNNAEFAGCFRYEQGKNEQHACLFTEVYAWLSRLDAPRTIAQAVEAAGQDCGWLRERHAPPGPGEPRFVSNLDEAIWPQLRALAGAELTRCTALSPYFDHQPKILNELADLELRLYSERGKTTMTEAWLASPSASEGRAQLLLTSYADDDHARTLHAKAVVLHGPRACLLAYGSANFTTPALFATPRNGNCECVLAVPGLAADFNADALFDPHGRASPAQASELGPVDDTFERAPGTALHLAELCLDKQSSFSALLHGPLDEGKLALVVEVDEHEPERLELQAAGTHWSAHAPEALAERCARLPAIAHVELRAASGELLTSNPVFVHNLTQLDAGDHRVARRVQVATESAAQFYDELNRLLDENEEDQLIRFFQLCDIRISGRPRLQRGRMARPAIGEGARGSRLRGRPARTLALALHPAALDFVDRHHNRLARHTRAPTIEGIPSFMHVARAIIDVCDTQLTRMSEGIARDPMRPHAWKACREFMSDYLVRVERLLELLVRDYLPSLTKTDDSGRVGPELRVDVAKLHDRCDSILELRDRVKAARPTVKIGYGKQVPADFFPNDVLHAPRWQMWSESVSRSLHRIEAHAGP